MDNRFALLLISFLLFIYNIYLKIRFVFFQNIRIKEALKKNRALKNTYSGKDCFILGNGPSLKEIDFSLLRDEYVFTVNLLYKHPDFQKLKSNIHVFSDNNFFSDNNSNIAEDIKKNLTNKGTKVFLPAKSFDYIKKYLIDQDSDIYLINSYLHFNNSFNTKIKLDKYTIDFSTVILQCIQIAVYMGFKTIYLIGIDCTGIIGIIENYLKENNSEYYCFSMDKDVKVELSKASTQNDFDSIFYSQGNIFRQYRVVNRALSENGIKIYNLSSRSLVKSIERKDFSTVIKNRKQARKID